MRVLGRGILLVASLGLALTAVEVTLRNFYPQYGGCDYGQSDAELHATLIPNYTATCIAHGHESLTEVRTNALGLRDEPVKVPKPPRVDRIMVLGDSTTFGVGVGASETVPDLLEADVRARESGGRTFEVINAGVPGYGTAQEWILYKRLAPTVDPDVVVLVFLVTNDVQDNLCEDGRAQPCFALAEDGTLVGARRDPSTVATSGRTWSVSINALHSLVLVQSRLSGWLTENVLVASLLQRISFHSPLGLPTTLAAWYDTSRATKGWALTRALLQQLVHDVRADGRQFVLAVLPGRPQTSAEVAAVVEQLYGDRPEGHAFRTEPERPQRWLSAWASEVGVTMVDLLEPLRHASATGRIHLLDGHFNAVGNAVIAREIGRALVECCTGGIPPSHPPA